MGLFLREARWFQVKNWDIASNEFWLKIAVVKKKIEEDR